VVCAHPPFDYAGDREYILIDCPYVNNVAAGSRFGINGVLFYGPPAVGDYVRRGARLQALPTEVFGQFQYVVGLDIGHNMLSPQPVP
jgi:hypothetical protein